MWQTTKCKDCGQKVDDNGDFCHNCGARLKESSQDFVYNQMFDLLKLEISRTARLDSKAHTYIGFLSIAITILASLGGLIIESIKTEGKIMTDIIIFISIIYVFVALFFIIGVLFAFRAYHTGSIFVRKQSNNKGQSGTKLKRSHPKSNKVFLGLDLRWLSENYEMGLPNVQKYLISHILEIHSRRRSLNNQKSNNILYAYIATITSVLLLLCMVIIIGIYGMGLL